MQKLCVNFTHDVLLRQRANAVLIAAAVAFLAFILVSCVNPGPATNQRTAPLVDDPIGRAFASGKSDVQVEGDGTVIRVLADDLDGSHHQTIHR